MRHGLLTHPADPRAVRADDQFMFGPDLLAAPVLAPGATRRRLYLPRRPLGRPLAVGELPHAATAPCGSAAPGSCAAAARSRCRRRSPSCRCSPARAP